MSHEKIGLEDLEILRKYTMQTRNWYVSGYMDNFTCGARALLLTEGNRRIDERTIGVSKEEHKVSVRIYVAGFLGCINGGS